MTLMSVIMMPEYPYPCPYCKEGIITKDMDEMGSVCNKCFKGDRETEQESETIDENP